MYSHHFADSGQGICEWGAFLSGHGMFGWLLPVLFWVVIISALIWLVRKLVRSLHPEQQDNALNILRKRYASGEVTEEEFDKMKAKLFS